MTQDMPAIDEKGVGCPFCGADETEVEFIRREKLRKPLPKPISNLASAPVSPPHNHHQIQMETQHDLR